MFNSRLPEYRSPMGAVEEGTKVHFKITMPRYLSCSHAYLIMEKDGEFRKSFDMFWCGMNGDDKEWWECDFTPDTAGLYFYSFEARTNRGHMAAYKGIGGQANAGGNGNRWQLTVYRHDLKTPDWLAGGIMYQIFPDRFCFSGEKKENVPNDRTLRDDWGAVPEWRPNGNGVVTNSDYFQGDFKGVMQKLSYLKKLGVTCIYFNPVFEAHSNHRYNTADYSKIDPLLGTEEDFKELCKKAKEQGIHIILDGVFSHTGSDSLYFNREGRYTTDGAFNSQQSPYYPWYSFKNWPNEYESWWNFDTLPNVTEVNPEYNEYINGENGIIRKWIRDGSSGWRLDVADELPDEFIDKLHAAAKAEDPDALVLGEVWEDASNKSAYGIRRRYLLGGQLDTVMNYPFRDAILGFLTGYHSSLCMEKIEDVLENYPPQVIRLLMNHIGTHDTERAITVLAGEAPGYNGRDWQSTHHLSPEQWETGLIKMRLASLLQFMLPGVPCIYYGDEAGTEGYKDPFNRSCYPWGNEHKDLVDWYRQIAGIRAHYDIFKEGALRNAYSHKSVMSFERYLQDEDGNEEAIFVAVNRSDRNADVPVKLENAQLIFGTPYAEDFKLPPYGFSVLHILRPKKADSEKTAE